MTNADLVSIQDSSARELFWRVHRELEVFGVDIHQYEAWRSRPPEEEVPLPSHGEARQLVTGLTFEFGHFCILSNPAVQAWFVRTDRQYVVWMNIDNFPSDILDSCMKLTYGEIAVRHEQGWTELKFDYTQTLRVFIIALANWIVANPPQPHVPIWLRDDYDLGSCRVVPVGAHS